MSAASEVTQLLINIGKDKKGYEKLYPLIYDQLCRIAYMKINTQGKDLTLSRTELVHETYLKMVDRTQISFNDRNHFLAIASKCMRQILIDYARKKQAQKRGGNNQEVTYIDKLFGEKNSKSKELLDIDDALNRLSELNERLSNVVEMRFFGEMTIEETASALEISESTVKRDWMKARGWLFKELEGRYKVNN